ncbi:MAG TPA: DUF6644 family protein [Candidatus Baltobacteraceae bacterium]|nr:DUF6644 family protein [Candidatus Baltobacteraceae bacterium]
MYYSRRNPVAGGPRVIQHFCDWLSNTPVSLKIQTILWIIPAVQTVHILSVSIVMASMAMLDLRLMGLAGKRQPVSRMVDRFVPWVWRVLVILFCTGVILTIGEPERELLNWAFRTKMAMVATVSLITLLVQQMNKRDATFWETRRFAAAAVGGVSLLLWVAIVTAGRWIAYV